MKNIVKMPDYKQVLNLKNINNLVYEKIPVEELKPNTVLLKVKACGICSSDIERVYKTGTYHFPTVIGHEFSGEVVAVYDDKNENLLGKKTAVFPLLPCNKCESCLNEKYALCNNYNYFGSRCNGGFSEYLVVPIWNLVFFEQISFEEAALCEPAAVGLHAAKKVDKNSNEVLIVGTGTIAFLIGLFLQKMGIKVLMAGRREESLLLAKKYGFIPVLNDENIQKNLQKAINKEYVDTTIEVVGSNEAINTAFKLATKEVILVGNPKDNVNLEKNNYWRILRKEINVKGCWNSDFGSQKNDWKEVLKMAENKEIDLSKLITKVYDMKDYQEAFSLVKSNNFTLKVLIKTNGSD